MRGWKVRMKEKGKMLPGSRAMCARDEQIQEDRAYNEEKEGKRERERRGMIETCGERKMGEINRLQERYFKLMA